jgi:chemotaxis protein CheX
VNGLEKSVNVKFLNPFASSVREILDLELHETVERGDLRLETGSYATDDVTVVLSLVGTIHGTVFFSMSNESAIELASALMGEKFHTLDKLAQSGIAELGNVITGRASTKLAQAGYEVEISTPSLILGRDGMISTLEYPRLIVPFETSIGSIILHLALRDDVHGA